MPISRPSWVIAGGSGGHMSPGPKSGVRPDPLSRGRELPCERFDRIAGEPAIRTEGGVLAAVGRFRVLRKFFFGGGFSPSNHAWMGLRNSTGY